MPVGTAVHARTLPLCESLCFRDWSGYYAALSYETRHDHEYTGIRTGAALIDVCPLFKYSVTGPDATRFVDRLVTRDMRRVAVGQVVYTPWCDGYGRVVDDGTVARLDGQRYRWTAAEPNLRWFLANAAGLDVTIEDVSERIAALALQGPMSARILRDAGVDIEQLRYYRVTGGRLAGVGVDVSRTGYTGDLGYEIWMPWDRAVTVWDALMGVGRLYNLRPAGLNALDVARIEAGLLLIDVDFAGSRRAVLPSHSYSPFEMGLGRLVSLDKAPFIGQTALREEAARGHQRQIVGIEIDWDDIEARYAAAGLPPHLPVTASRVPVPVYRGRVQVGKATSTAWSPILKKLIALATVRRDAAESGTRLDVELTVEAERHVARATVVKTPFFNPPRKTVTPPP